MGIKLSAERDFTVIETPSGYRYAMSSDEAWELMIGLSKRLNATINNIAPKGDIEALDTPDNLGAIANDDKALVLARRIKYIQERFNIPFSEAFSVVHRADEQA